MGEPLLHRRRLIMHSNVQYITTYNFASIQFHFICPDTTINLHLYSFILWFQIYIYIFHEFTVWHQRHTEWNGLTDLLGLYQSALCQYLSLTAWGLVLRARIPFHTIEHGIRLTVSALIWSSLSLSCGGFGSWPTYWFYLLFPHSILYIPVHKWNQSKQLCCNPDYF